MMKCITDDCSRPVRIRGVCECCRQAMQKLVNAGKTTWDKLEKQGKIAPKKKAFRTGDNSMMFSNVRQGGMTQIGEYGNGEYMWA